MSSNVMFAFLVRAARAYTRASSPIAFLARRFIRQSAGSVSGPCTFCVDIGAGNAPYFHDVVTAFGIEHYVAVDISPNDRTSIVADARALPMRSRSVQLVLSFDAIQHVAEPEKVIEEMARVLVPGGCAIITFPFLYAECDFRDYQRWTMEGMCELLTRHGLGPVRQQRRGGPLFAGACALNWALQHMVPGQRKSWRQPRVWTAVVRLTVIAVLTIPTTVISWLALWSDSVMRGRGAYMGGAVLARRIAEARQRD
jgi:ubiquinone/menaquinone biosynthesis C-methylase UbiE